jgi:SAM-dependent MidA family methyltransferase
MTVAAVMDLALYDPHHGYYSTAPRRSGRAGDFYTSVDVGSLFGEMVALLLDEVRTRLGERGAGGFDLVEAGAGDARLTRDILDTAARQLPALYESVRVTIVERSAAARDAAAKTLARHTARVRAITDEPPAGVTGVILANELLDALPTHAIVNTEEGLREIYVDARDGALVEVAGPLSCPALAERLAAGPPPDVGWRGEISLAADEWIAQAARSLQRGCLLLFDYGHESGVLRSSSHAAGTLTAYSRHTADRVNWLDEPGSADLTAHVDLTAVRRAAERAGLGFGGCVDQTYFLIELGITDRVPVGSDVASTRCRLAARTLLSPGGLGSTMKAVAFTKRLAGERLRGFAHGRLT